MKLKLDDIYKICEKFNVNCIYDELSEHFSSSIMYNAKIKRFEVQYVRIPNIDKLGKLCEKLKLSYGDCLKLIEKNIEHEVKHEKYENEVLAKCNEYLYLFKTLPKISRAIFNLCEDVAIEKELEKYGAIWRKQCQHVEESVKTLHERISTARKKLTPLEYFQYIVSIVSDVVTCYLEDNVKEILDRVNIPRSDKEFIRRAIDIATKLRDGEIGVCECIGSLLSKILTQRQ